MLKKLFVIVLILVCGLAAFAQDKPRLGILPFTGGPEGDADTITTLLTYHSDILQAFSPVPITNAVKAQAMEQSFQLSDWVDADISSGLGRLMNADFVISGQIRRIGTQNIVIISLVNVKTFELLAGVCREYNKLDEIPGFLPEIAQTFVSASRKNTSMLPRLAVLPPAIASEVANAQEAETLAQILSIELANMGRYAVLPRIVTGLAIEKEMSIRMMEYTPVDTSRVIGRAVNARFMLNTEVRVIGNANMMAASIYGVDEGNLISGGYRNYYAMLDGRSQMAELARILLGGSQIVPVLPPPVLAERPAPPPVEPPPPPPPPVQEPPPPPPAEPPPPPPQEDPAMQLQSPPPPPAVEVVEEKPAVKRKPHPSQLWTVGVSAGTSLAIPWAVATVHGTIAPVRYTFFELGLDVGLLSGEADVKYYSLYPFAHLAFFMPFPGSGGFYIGAGGGYMMSFYTFPEGDITKRTFALDAIAGFNLWNVLDISYTARSNLTAVNHKISVGYTYRF